MKIDRMLTTIVMLLNRDRISAKELAEKFEISVRTVYRDIDAINMAGIPIVVAAFEGAFGELESISDTKLTIFAVQVGAIAGFDALVKGGFKAAKK